jgi:hypothetical protein
MPEPEVIAATTAIAEGRTMVKPEQAATPAHKYGGSPPASTTPAPTTEDGAARGGGSLSGTVLAGATLAGIVGAIAAGAIRRRG